MVTGRPGTGKTMLVETFLKETDSSKVVARRIAVSSYGATDLLRAIAYAYGIDAAGMEKGTMRHRIQQFFLQQEQAGRRVLLIIDEAQTLSHAALEELRILADLQTRSRLMLQLVLVGQESLQELMRIPDMEQFQQRVIANYQLVPLNLTDTRSYIEHRLLQAGWNGDPEFSGEAVLSIYQLSNGVPRHINKICNRLLLLGFGKGSHAIEVQDVLEISAEMREERLTPMDTSQARLYDIENVTNLSEIRDGQVSVADLAIRASKMDACAIAISKGSRLAAHNREAFIARHQASPASNQERIAPRDAEEDVPVAVVPRPLQTANPAPAASHTPEDVAVEGNHPGRLSRGKLLAVAVALLVLLAFSIAKVPSFSGRELVSDMLTLVDQFPGRDKQPALWEEGPVSTDGDSGRRAKTEAVDRHSAHGDGNSTAQTGPVAGANPLAVGVIERSQTKVEVPRQVDHAPVPMPSTAESTGQAVQTHAIDTLLAQASEALDDYRLVTPEGDNAYEYLNRVLQQDPENEAARAGIQKIVVIYRTLAAKAAADNDIESASRYLDRGLGIQPDNPGLLAMKDTIDRRLKTAPVSTKSPSPGAQTTYENAAVREPPSLKKRQAADRRHDIVTASDQGG